jgi:acyl-CoA reductase-like NAD-dependent aldehyde dehydrogenase
MADMLETISPVDGGIYVERPLADGAAIEAVLARAALAQRDWRAVPMGERQAMLTRAVDAFVAMSDTIAEELTWQMGRPLSQSPGEVRGFEERARYMIEAAPRALADIEAGPKEGFRRFITREPLGVVAVVAPWNFPYLTSVNSVIPALMAGNAVVLKHSHQTPLCAERYAQALAAAGLPDGVFQVLHMSHAGTEKLIQDSRIDYVAFTGSVPGGHSIQQSLAGRFIGAGMELGGKDPAYVRADADLAFSVENLVDGLGNPMEADTNLGPMVRASAADFVRGQVADAVKAGARSLVDPSEFPADAPGTPYMAPRVLVDVDHSMRVMTEESFGPVIGIMKVTSDDAAVALMNDSEFGLTASVWTTDADAAIAVGEKVETGTWFMNRCDYLDPALAWTGVKNSGRGCTLSVVGYEHLTRPKSYHLRTAL